MRVFQYIILLTRELQLKSLSSESLTLSRNLCNKCIRICESQVNLYESLVNPETFC